MEPFILIELQNLYMMLRETFVRCVA